MYPATYFDAFPAFPRKNTVFVAMSFDPAFRPRWERVIRPAIDNAGMEPDRVDAGKISDSILTEILSGIAQSQLVFADVTSVNNVRNANVMYEVGIAHAVRQPQAVVLFRSDTDRLLFDLANVRVNFYEPDNDPKDALNEVSQAIQEAFREIDLGREIAVQNAANRIDYPALAILFDAVRHITSYPETSTSEFKAAVGRLLDMGLLQSVFEPVAVVDGVPSVSMMVESCRYKITPFGKAVFEEIFFHRTMELRAEDAGTKEVKEAFWKNQQ